MRNVLILGSGRSGTSMLAGTLSKAGYYMGAELYTPRGSNPKGFFEDPEINDINECILEPYIPPRIGFLGMEFLRHRPRKTQRWLAKIPLSAKIEASDSIAERIKKQVNTTPYCFKDPRFSYTIPVWRPYLKNAGFICTFREPAVTVESILKECTQQKYLQDLAINYKIALEVWESMYLHILKLHRHKGDWLFIHFDQVLTKEGLNAIEKFTQSSVDRSFPEEKLRRSLSSKPVPKKIEQIYQQLCELAKFQPSL